MKNALKKAISILLVAVMVFGAAPLAGFVGLELPELNLFSTKVEAATSGYYTYIVSNGEAKITEVNPLISGDITIPSTLGAYPVTSIGNRAFYECTNITTITIPYGVVSIGGWVFYNCDNLTSLTIPDSVTNIDSYTFSGCPSLASVAIPDSVTSIGDYAFSSCPSLASVTIPDSVTSIGDCVFYDCNSLTNITIPDSVTSIGDYAFADCPNLASVTIGNGVTSIGKSAFYDCDCLTSITIPDSIVRIGDSAFYDCNGLRSVTIGTVSSIGYSAFRNCNNLKITYYTGSPKQWKYITIEEYNKSLTNKIIFGCNSERPYYGSGACGNSLTWKLYTDGELVISGTGDMTDTPWSTYNSSIKSVTISDGVTSIGYKAFYSCINLADITIPDSVTSIGDWAFYNCDSLTNVYYEGDVADWCGIDFKVYDSNPMKYADNSYINGKLLEGDIIIPDGVTSIGISAFGGCDDITSVTIPDSVTSIYYAAFINCDSLASVTIGKGIRTIGDLAFSSCDSLANSYYPGTPEQWKKVLVGSNNEDLICNMIYECNSERPYYGSGTCGESLTWKLYVDGELVISGMGDMTNTPWSNYNSSIKSVTISDGVTNLGYKAFYTCINLTDITIPDSVTSIGSYAFSDCTSLESITIPDSVASIGEWAFSSCKSLTNVTIGKGVRGIDRSAFLYCSALEEIFIPHTVSRIAADAFKGTNVKIVCYANSTAHQFAIDNGIKFELVKVILNETALVLKVGEYSIITATPEQEYIESVELTWKSSNANIAVVDGNGKVTAKRNGEVIIFALAPNGSTLATCLVNIISTEAVKADVVNKPTQTTISYGDSIILHVDASMIPVGGRVEWSADNGNFKYSANGESCTISPNKSGNTTFTAIIYDAEGNAVLKDEQTMTSKAGFFDKIIAFFKKLFGLTKVIPQAFKGIY